MGSAEEIEKSDATDMEVQQIRDIVTEHVKENGSADFDNRDLQKLRSDRIYVNRFFRHVSELPEPQVEQAANMIINTFKWRKETKIADLNENDLSETLKEKGVLYSKSRDIDGKKLLIFEVKKHFKGKEKVEDVRNYLLYFIERLQREENGDKLSLVFDCSGSGIRNMDMEFIQYMLGVFKEYVPDVLNYILVFEMPWVLNAAWKIIKSWLPAAAVRKIKFLSKSNVTDFVPEDQVLPAWGGDFEWEYSFEPENMSPNPPAYESLTPEPAMDEEKQKKVQFLNSNPNFNNNDGSSQASTPTIASNRQSIDSFTSVVSRTNSIVNQKNLLELNPGDEVVFSHKEVVQNQEQGGDSKSDLVGKVEVKNISESSSVGFKIKTTSPDKYRVRPSMAQLKPGSSACVEIFVQVPAVSSVSNLVKDKFLITAVILEEDNLSHAQLAEVVKTKKPDAQYRLRCSLSACADVPFPGSTAPTQTIESSVHNPRNSGRPHSLQTSTSVISNDKQSQKQFDSLVKKVGAISEANSALRNELSFVKTLLYVVLFLLIFLTIIVILRTPLLTAETCTNLLLHTALRAND